MIQRTRGKRCPHYGTHLSFIKLTRLPFILHRAFYDCGECVLNDEWICGGSDRNSFNDLLEKEVFQASLDWYIIDCFWSSIGWIWGNVKS